MLLRVLRYRESLNSTDAASFFDAELALPDGEPDLQLSVYRASLEELEQVALEHYAFAGLDPPRHATAIDVAPMRPSGIAEPTSSPFSFTRDAHCYIAFRDRDDQLSFASMLVQNLQVAGVQGRSVEKARLREWLAARLAEGDAEWASFLANAGTKWRKYPKPG